jgi:hypothetical protein
VWPHFQVQFAQVPSAFALCFALRGPQMWAENNKIKGWLYKLSAGTSTINILVRSMPTFSQLLRFLPAAAKDGTARTDNC